MKINYTLSGLIHNIESEKNVIRFQYNDGNLKSISYYKIDDEYEMHREDGPAIITYTFGGSLRLEQYWNNGQLHREDGPAHIEYSNGVSGLYYIHDEHFTKREYDIWQLNQLLNSYDLHVKFTPDDGNYIIFNLINEDIIGRSSFENLEINVMELIS